MSDAAKFEFEPFHDEAPVDWALDPMGDASGGMLAVRRVALVRIACVAAETGARMQRDGLSVDPIGWMISPLELFEGRPPIEACMEREACLKAILLHGLGLDLDTNPAEIEQFMIGSPLALGLEGDHG